MKTATSSQMTKGARNKMTGSIRVFRNGGETVEVEICGTRELVAEYLRQGRAVMFDAGAQAYLIASASQIEILQRILGADLGIDQGASGLRSFGLPGSAAELFSCLALPSRTANLVQRLDGIGPQFH